MRTIHFSDIINLRDRLQSIDNGQYAASLTRCRETAQKVLGYQGVSSGDSGGSPVFNVLDDCSLAVQFLSVGLVSYCQAHIGQLETFFLEEKLETMKLLGSASRSTSAASMCATLRHFTCLREMTSAPVMVFTRSDQARSHTSSDMDLLARPEDLLDTWGPGEMIRRPGDDETRLRALTVRGGVIDRSSGSLFHWQRLDSYTNAIDDETFAMDEAIRIGAELDVNMFCTKHEQYWIQLCQHYIRPLGTAPARMRRQGLEYGTQAGQFGLVTFNLVLEKVPGVSLKDVMTERLRMGLDYTSFLSTPCGLQFSFCSGLARRVRIRDMLAELLPVYAKRKMPPSPLWSKLEKDYDIVSVLSESTTDMMANCLEDMHTSDPACFQYLWDLTFELVSSIKSTGFDLADTTFAVAIISSVAEEPLTRVVFSASGPNYWTRALRDTETCATFAYFTLACLQVGGKGCRRTESSWHRRVSMLQTEVARSISGHRPWGLPKLWTLRDGDSYQLGSTDADDHIGVLVDVIRPQPSDYPRLVVRRSLTPLWAWKRLAQKRHMHLQERLGPSDSVVAVFMTSTQDAAFDESP